MTFITLKLTLKIEENRTIESEIFSSQFFV